MSSITQPVTQIAPDIDSFGAGGQMYMASIWGGVNVTQSQINPLFAFRATDNNVANAAQLTNLMEAQKVGSTMAFRAVRLGFRVLSFKDTVTNAEVEAMKKLLASAVVTLTVGANETKIAEFSGLDIMQAVDVATAEAGVNSGMGGGTSYIPLSIPVEIQANVNIGGTIRFTRPVPAALTATDNSFGFVVIMQGLKIVKS